MGIGAVHRGEITCYNCGRAGHCAAECGKGNSGKKGDKGGGKGGKDGKGKKSYSDSELETKPKGGGKGFTKCCWNKAFWGNCNVQGCKFGHKADDLKRFQSSTAWARDKAIADKMKQLQQGLKQYDPEIRKKAVEAMG